MTRLNFFNQFDFSKIDFILLSLFFVLSFSGLIILASASVHFSDLIYGNPSAIFNRQLFYFFLGLFGLLIFFVLPLNFWISFDRLLITLGFILLLMVFVPGIGFEVNGANRWIRVAGLGLQPSEIMKFLSILYVSSYSVRRMREIQSQWI